MHGSQLLERPVKTSSAQSILIGKALNQVRMILEAIRIDPDADRREPHFGALGAVKVRARAWQQVDGLELPPLLAAIARD